MVIIRNKININYVGVVQAINSDYTMQLFFSFGLLHVLSMPFMPPATYYEC